MSEEGRSHEHHVNPQSWQPILLRTLLDETVAQRRAAASGSFPADDAAVAYLLSDRGWRLLRVLSAVDWKQDDDLGDIGDLVENLLKPLQADLLAIDWEECEDDVTFSEWDYLTRTRIGALVETSAAARVGCERSLLSPKGLGETRRQRRRRAKLQPSRKRRREMDAWSASSDTDAAAAASAAPHAAAAAANGRPPKTNEARCAASNGVSVSPYVLHEDSDGFPLCWNEDAPIPSTKGAHLWLDDMILEMLEAQLPTRSPRRSETGVALMLLAVLERVVGLLTADALVCEAHVRAVAEFCVLLLNWSGAAVDRRARQLRAVFSPPAVAAFHVSVLVAARWVSTLVVCMRALAERTIEFRAGGHELLCAVRAALAQLRAVCALLGSGGGGDDCADGLRGGFELWGAGDELFDLLLESADRLAIGLCRVMATAVRPADASTGTLTDHLRVAVQMLSISRDAGFGDCVRDLAIALDLMAQIDGSVVAFKSAARQAAGDSGARLRNLLFSVAALSRELQFAKSLWLHLSLCRRTSHERCNVAGSALALHHHGILELHASPSSSPVEAFGARNLRPHRRCACVHLLRLLFQCMRNVVGSASKELCLSALQRSASCCCQPPDVFLTHLLGDLPEQPAATQKQLLRCLQTHLTVASLPQTLALNSSMNSLSSAADLRLYCCRFCDREDNGSVDSGSSSSLSGATGYVSILADFFQNCDSPVLHRLCRLVWSILPGLSKTSRELLTSQALVTCLSQACDRVLTGGGGVGEERVELGATSVVCNRQEVALLNSLLGLVNAGLTGEHAYDALVQHILPRADLLLYAADTQNAFVGLLKTAVVVESQLAADFATARSESIRQNLWPMNKYVFDKFLLTTEMALKDLAALLDDSASVYWLVLTNVFDLCRSILGRKLQGFEQMYRGHGGRRLCVQLALGCLSQLRAARGGGASESKSAQRLAGLLGLATGVALAADADSAKQQVVDELSELLLEGTSGGDAASALIGRPTVAHRLCAVLTDCALGGAPSLDVYEAHETRRLLDMLAQSYSEESSMGSYLKQRSPLADTTNESQGYEGDVECSPAIFARDFTSAVAVIRYPQLCVLALKYLLGNLERTAAKEDWDFVIAGTMQKIRLLCASSSENLTLLRDAGILPLLMDLTVASLDGSVKESTAQQVLSLFASFVQAAPSPVDLEMLLTLANKPLEGQGLVINTLSSLLADGSLGPSHYLCFPRRAPQAAPSPAKFTQSASASGWRDALLPRKMRSDPRADRSRRRSVDVEALSHSPATPEPASGRLRSGLSSIFASGKERRGAESVNSATLPSSMRRRAAAGSHQSSAASVNGARRHASATAAARHRRRSFAALPGVGGEAAALLDLQQLGMGLRHGMSLSCWIRLNKAAGGAANDTNEPEWWHVVTLGALDLSCTFFAHNDSDQMMVKILSRGEVILEKRTKRFLPVNKWTHLVVSMQIEKMESLLLAMCINGVVYHKYGVGWSCEEIHLSSGLLVGLGCLHDGEAAAQFSMDIGNVMAFKGAIGHEASLLLCSLGPRCSTVADTRCRALESCVQQALKPALLVAQTANVGRLLDDKDGVIESLQKTLLLCYLPSAPEQYNVYVLQQPTVSDVAPGETVSYLSLTRLRSFQVDWKCEWASRGAYDIDDALSALGGVGALFVLFARTVELSAPAPTQATALALLLRAAGRHAEWQRAFANVGGYSLAAQILVSELAHVGRPLFSMLMKCAVSGDHERDHTLIIQNPELLSVLLTQYHIWKKDWIVWEIAISTLVACTSEQNQFHAFNVQQLHRANFLRRLLQICIEITQEAAASYWPSPTVAQWLVRLIGSLLGHPPDLAKITQLWDFVFLSHPASCTYLNYRIAGNNDWIVTDALVEQPINVVRHESQLARQLRQYLTVLGQETLTTIMMGPTGGVTAARHAYDTAVFGEAGLSRPISGRALMAALQDLSPSVSTESSDEDDAIDQDHSPPSVSQDRRRASLSAATAAGGGGEASWPPVARLRDSIPRLPDLVCDIDASAAASGARAARRSTTTSDSGDDWSADEAPSSAATDEYATASSDEHAFVAAVNPEDMPWIVETRAGLLELLSVVFLTGPDTVVRRLVGANIKWESLVVMLNHQPNALVRGACVRALCALLMRSDDSLRLRFLRANGFQLIANQLREYACTPTIADSLFSLLCGESLRLEDGLDAGHIHALQVDRFQCGALEPILAILPNSLHDLTIFWNVTASLQKIFENNGTLAQAMLDKRLVEVLVAALVQLAENSLNEPTGCHQDAQLILECWQSLAQRVLQNCVAFADLIHHQACVELVTLTSAADLQTARRHGVRSSAHAVVRRQLCSLLQVWLESIRTLYAEDTLSASAVVSMDSVAASNFGSRRSTPNASGRSTPTLMSSYSQSDSVTNLSFQTVPQQNGIFSGSLSNLKMKLQSFGSGSQLSLKGRYRSRGSPTFAGHSELVERLKLCLQFCGDLFLFQSPGSPVSDEEEHLFEFYLYFLLSTAKKDPSKQTSQSRRANGSKSWQRLLWSCRDKVRQLLAHIVAFVLFPAQTKLQAMAEPQTAEQPRNSWIRRRQLLLARSLAHEVQYKQMLKTLLDINLDYQYAMNLALHELVLDDADRDKAPPTAEQLRARSDVEKLLRFLKHLKIYSPLLQLDEAKLRSLCTDEQLCLQTYQEQRQAWLQRLRSAVSRIRMRQQTEAEPVSDAAMAITCAVLAEQNVPRKLFIRQSKQELNEQIRAAEVWRAFALDLCHPGASFHDEASWPASWCLDPTEGPNRERRRLMACHLDVAESFVLAAARAKLQAATAPPPLSLVLARASTAAAAAAGQDAAAAQLEELAGQLIDRLHIDEAIAFSTPATILRSTFECSGEILLGDRSIYFVGEKSRSTQKGLPQQELISMTWAYDDVTEVYKRHHQLLDVAIEVFFSHGETYLISFETVEKRNYFLHRLLTMDLPNLNVFSDSLLQAMTQWWRDGSITNFEYLTHLNKLAGRSFSDLMQYPVFPFILSDYHSLNLDLNSPIVYRNLSKPIAIQDRKMEDHFVKVYKCLEAEARRAPAAAVAQAPVFGPYHYGSHYSNSGIVCHYLVRLPPFTMMALEYQDNNFDIPDRLFSSLETTWRLSSAESTTDFKELIPEFFFMPEFLCNFEGLNLGVRQAGTAVADVTMPPWCADGDPRLFVAVHRQALEAQHVTAYLHQWVDLVFGYKQTGQASIDAVNVFHPATYHGTHVTVPTGDELQMNAVKTMVRTYGQMPKQLFRAPHLPHFVARPTPAVPSSKLPKGPLPTVAGVRWGAYVGSAESGEPVLVLKQRASAAAELKPSRLSVVGDDTCIGLPDKCLLLVLLRVVKRVELSPWSIKEVDSLALVSHAFADAVLRGRIMSPEPGGPWISLAAMHDNHTACMAYSSSKGRLFVGLKSGVVRVYQIDHRTATIRNCELVKTLVGGFRDAVTVVEVCQEFSLVVCGCADGQLTVWDLNKLSYVRHLTREEGGVTHCAVSPTTADVVSVAQFGYGSRVTLHTVNGRCVNRFDSHISVCSLAVSTLPEGTAVNCAVIGLQNGVIRFFNLWTLQLVRELSHNSFLEPIDSLAYAHNCRKLYACTRNGTVLCWESTSSRQNKPPRYTCANPRM